MTVGTLIAAAFPRHAAKHLEAELGCTRRQAWRMVSTGIVPVRFQVSFIQVVQSALSLQKSLLARVDDEIKRLDYEAMVARSATRRAEASGADAAGNLGQGDRPAAHDALTSPAARGGR